MGFDVTRPSFSFVVVCEMSPYRVMYLDTLGLQLVALFWKVMEPLVGV